VAAVVRPVAASAPRPGALAVAAPAVPAASAATGPGRFVVQAGAYTDAAKLREARQKVEKLGLKTYTQVIDTEAGKRTRVRVGPFTTRQEADAVAAKVKSAGLQANVLTL
jgi:DedD protein